MKGEVLVISFDGRSVVHEYEGEIPLSHLQKIVGGSPEMVPYFDTVRRIGREQECVVYCNVEGKLKGFPRNDKATRMWDQSLELKDLSRHSKDGVELDYLVGPIAIITGDDEFMRRL